MNIGDQLVLTLKLWDEKPDKYVRSFLFADNSVHITTKELEHVSDGFYKYTNPSLLFPSGTKNVFAYYIVYDDPAYMHVSRYHQDAMDTFSLGDGANAFQEIFTQMNDLTQLVRQMNNITLNATVYTDDSITGSTIEPDTTVGVVVDPDSLVGVVIDPPSIAGVVESESGVIGDIIC